ncbi:MAG: ATP-grasp domain-containing protein [Candidatus Omnitrophota bacterium]|jgi:D-alanine-D-alanine ligase
MKKTRILIAVAKEDNERKDISDVLRCKNSILNVLSKKNIKTGVLFVERKDFNNTSKLKKTILNKNPHCIFNLFEGFGDEPFREADFAEILERTNIPFTGNPSFALRACLDKAKAKNILKKMGIPVPAGIVVKNIKNLKMNNLNFPVFVKPCSEDASVGIDKDSLVYSERKLPGVLRKRLKKFSKGIIVEDFLPGAEYSVAFLGNNKYEVLGVSMIDYSLYKKMPLFLTYASKWEEKTDEFKKIMPSCGASIDKSLKKRIINLAKEAANALGCRGYFRVDLRTKGGKIFIIDVNPNPDINVDSGYVKQADQSGYSYPEIIEKIIQLSGATEALIYH